MNIMAFLLIFFITPAAFGSLGSEAESLVSISSGTSIEILSEIIVLPRRTVVTYESCTIQIRTSSLFVQVIPKSLNLKISRIEMKPVTKIDVISKNEINSNEVRLHIEHSEVQWVACSQPLGKKEPFSVEEFHKAFDGILKLQNR